MQRLYSTFANAGPGKGLLLLRLVVSSFLIADARSVLMERSQFASIVLALFAVGTGLLLCVGLWTPIAGAITAILELGAIFLRPDNTWPFLLAASIGAGLALLGPGSWSVDAQIFGRRRISIEDR